MVELLGSLRLKKKDWTNKVNNKVRYTKYIEKLKNTYKNSPERIKSKISNKSVDCL